MIRLDQKNLIIADPYYVLPKEIYDDFYHNLEYGYAFNYGLPVENRYVSPIVSLGEIIGYGAGTNYGEYTAVIDRDKLNSIVGANTTPDSFKYVDNFTGTLQYYGNDNGYTWVLTPDDSSLPKIYDGDIDEEKEDRIPEGSFHLTHDENLPSTNTFDLYLKKQSLRTCEDWKTPCPEPLSEVENYDTTNVDTSEFRESFYNKKNHREIVSKMILRYKRQLTGEIYRPHEIYTRIKEIIKSIEGIINPDDRIIISFVANYIFTECTTCNTFIHKESVTLIYTTKPEVCYLFMDLLACYHSLTNMPNIKNRFIFNTLFRNVAQDIKIKESIALVEGYALSDGETLKSLEDMIEYR